MELVGPGVAVEGANGGREGNAADESFGTALGFGGVASSVGQGIVDAAEGGVDGGSGVEGEGEREKGGGGEELKFHFRGFSFFWGEGLRGISCFFLRLGTLGMC